MDVLSDILATMKLAGTLYFRTDFSAPWGIQVPPFERVSRFHYVHHGRCHVRVADIADPVSLEQGDLIIITRGASHILSDPLDAEVETVDDVVSAAGFSGSGALVYGGQEAGHKTRLVCGHFAFDPDASHPLMDALPPYIHIEDNSDVAHAWLKNTLALIGSEAGRGQLGGELVTIRLSEIILAQAIRTYLATAARDDRVFAGFNDPHIRRALEAIHGDPAQAWTVERLGCVAGLSRTAFANRFHSAMGMTPLAYLTGWRMQVARRLLLESDRPMIEVAERSGYKSEASFGRIFKKHFSASPAGYRRQRRQASATTV